LLDYHVHAWDGFRRRDVDLQQAGAFVITHASIINWLNSRDWPFTFCGEAVLGVEDSEWSRWGRTVPG